MICLQNFVPNANHAHNVFSECATWENVPLKWSWPSKIQCVFVVTNKILTTVIYDFMICQRVPVDTMKTLSYYNVLITINIFKWCIQFIRVKYSQCFYMSKMLQTGITFLLLFQNVTITWQVHWASPPGLWYKFIPWFIVLQSLHSSYSVTESYILMLFWQLC